MTKTTKTTRSKLAAMIDHTLLKPDTTMTGIKKLCREAMLHRFHAVCVNPLYVLPAREVLAGSGVKVCTVVGFPLGATTSEVKVCEAVCAVRAGATEVDMVLNMGALKEGRFETVREDIRAVVEAVTAIDSHNLVKVIIETCYLNNEEKVTACLLAREAGAHFVKTSTGFGSSGATTEDVALMRKTVGNKMGGSRLREG